jgi:hypothetical protein
VPQSNWAEFYGHTPARIDIDRGVTGITSKAGFKISMYKQWPGLFLDPMGNEVDDDVARKAGFDVDALRKEALILKQIAEATAKIKADASNVEKSIRDNAEENPFEAPVADPGTPTEFNKNGDPRGTKHYVMDYLGGGYWNVLARDGGSKVVDRVKNADAIAGMYEAEREHIDTSGGAEAA